MAGVDQGYVLRENKDGKDTSRAETPRVLFVLDVLVVLVVLCAAWLLYGSVLRLWWTGDDFFHLRYQLTHRTLWYFFDASGYRDFPAKLLTPLLFLSLDVDRWLFGIAPRPFYVHQLLSLSLCPAALYAVLRLWLQRSWSAAVCAYTLTTSRSKFAMISSTLKSLGVTLA